MIELPIVQASGHEAIGFAWIVLTLVLLLAMTVRAVRFVASYIRRNPSATVFESHATWLTIYSVLTVVITVLGFSMAVFPAVWASVLLLDAAIGLVFVVFSKKAAKARLGKKAGEENKDNTQN